MNVSHQSVSLIGGDERTAYMAPLFAKKGWDVICYGTCPVPDIYCALSAMQDTYCNPNATQDICCNSINIKSAISISDAIQHSDILIFGIPFIKNGTVNSSSFKLQASELLPLLRPGQKIFAGVIPADFVKSCSEKDIECFDFMSDSTVALSNAVATAEGALIEAMLRLKTNIHQSKVLVLGYGRCGKVIADKLKGLSADVHVCTSSAEEITLARTLGYKSFPVSALQNRLNDFTLIFNTIPAPIFNSDLLPCLRSDALVIDIASGIGCSELTVPNIIRCPGLPGRYRPVSSAGILVDNIIQTLQEHLSGLSAL